MAVPTVYVRLPGAAAVRKLGNRSTSPAPGARPVTVPAVTVPFTIEHPFADAQV